MWHLQFLHLDGHPMTSVMEAHELTVNHETRNDWYNGPRFWDVIARFVVLEGEENRLYDAVQTMMGGVADHNGFTTIPRGMLILKPSLNSDTFSVLKNAILQSWNVGISDFREAHFAVCEAVWKGSDMEGIVGGIIQHTGGQRHYTNADRPDRYMLKPYLEEEEVDWVREGF